MVPYAPPGPRSPLHAPTVQALGAPLALSEGQRVGWRERACRRASVPAHAAGVRVWAARAAASVRAVYAVDSDEPLASVLKRGLCLMQDFA